MLYLLFTLYHLTQPPIRTPPSNLQPIATCGKIARGTLLVDIGCSSEREPPPLVITTKLAAAILVVAVVSTVYICILFSTAPVGVGQRVQWLIVFNYGKGPTWTSYLFGPRLSD